MDEQLILKLLEEYKKELNTHYVTRITLTGNVDYIPANREVLARLNGGIATLERVMRDLEHMLPSEDTKGGRSVPDGVSKGA